MTQTNSLPWSQLCEEGVLGSALLNPEILDWLQLDDADFFDPRHRALWQAMGAVRERGLDVDPITVSEELCRQGKLEAVGPLLASSAVTVGTASAVESYASELREHRVTRDVLEAAADISELAKRRESAGEELLGAALDRLARIQRSEANARTDLGAAAREFARVVGPEAEARAKGLEGGTMLATGIGPIDSELGGIPMGTLTGIAARYGGGKSALALNVALNVARRGRTSAIYTLEDPRPRWVERAHAREARVDLSRVAKREMDGRQLGAVVRAADELAKIECLHVVEAHGWGAREIVRHATGLRAELVVVDYAQKLASPERGLKKHEAIEENARLLGNHAGKSGSAVILLSQVLKGAKAENRLPTDEDLRYGEGVAQESKLLLILHDPQISGSESTRYLLVAKRNQGENNRVIEVTFEGAICEFR